MRMETKDYIEHSYVLARLSPDTTQNGAVIVDEWGNVVGKGCNRPPDGIEVGENKAYTIEHAERAAIYQGSLSGSLLGLTMYCPWAACPSCARAIIMCGIKTLVVHEERMALTPFRWLERVRVGLDMLDRSGVEVVQWSGKIGCQPILVNGEPWNP